MMQWSTLTIFALAVSAMTIFWGGYILIGGGPRHAMTAKPSDAGEPRIAFAGHLYEFLLAGSLLLVCLSEVNLNTALVIGLSLYSLVWVADAVYFSKQPLTLAEQATDEVSASAKSLVISSARLVVPVMGALLLVRTLVMPYRVMNDSMMPTLTPGDITSINAFAYGFRLPFFNTKLFGGRAPERGEVVAVRIPFSGVELQRVIGLPGDSIALDGHQVTVNKVPISSPAVGVYDDGCLVNFQLLQEKQGQHPHRSLVCATETLPLERLPSCHRNVRCGGQQPAPSDHWEGTVPAGHYYVLSDDRDLPSEDSRFVGFVPEQRLIGPVTRVWLTWPWPPGRVIR